MTAGPPRDHQWTLAGAARPAIGTASGSVWDESPCFTEDGEWDMFREEAGK